MKLPYAMPSLNLHLLIGSQNYNLRVFYQKKFFRKKKKKFNIYFAINNS